jgi:hypothetical protein
MMLMTTLRAETARLDREIDNLTRDQFIMLAVGDNDTARRLASEVARLKTQRADLIHGQPHYDLADE